MHCFQKNVELAEEFEHYRECLEKVEREIGEEQRIKVRKKHSFDDGRKRKGTSIKHFFLSNIHSSIQVVHAIRGADVILPCFTWCGSSFDVLKLR